jgi:hypothetical protein
MERVKLLGSITNPVALFCVELRSESNKYNVIQVADAGSTQYVLYRQIILLTALRAATHVSNG